MNNAGVATTGTIAEMSFEEFDLCMKVNVYGPVLMIKAFQPGVVERTMRKQIEQLVQLNEGQRYTLERAALIKMLDEALVGSRPRTPPAATQPSQ